MANYNEDSIRTLAWNEHIRERAGMYIGQLGNGEDEHDGIYVLLKEIIDNSIDEFTMGFGKCIEIKVTEKTAEVRDYGRGIPLGSVIKATSTLNTGGRFDDSVYQKTIGLNGVGTKAVNAMSESFYVASVRDGEISWGRFERGVIIDSGRGPSKEKNGTMVSFTPDPLKFVDYRFRMDYVEKMVKNYMYVKKGLTLRLNDVDYVSHNGLLDLVNDSMADHPRYAPIHLEGEGIEVILTHNDSGPSNYSSFVNGQNTYDGGTHLAALKEAVTKCLLAYYNNRKYTPEDCRDSLVGVISLQMQEPIFKGQHKSRMTSDYMWEKNGEKGPTVRGFVNDFIAKQLDDYLHINKDVAAAIENKIKEAVKEREEISEFRNTTKTKRSGSVFNANLNDCRVHYSDRKTKANEEFLDKTSVFITEGKSASGTVNKARNPIFQAVFSIRGKSKNSFRSSEAKVIENVELRNLVGALGISEGLEGLRYNKVILATDADNDGMHIRMLLMTFLLKYYRELVETGHVFILETPLFRVKNKKESKYCFTREEKDAAFEDLVKRDAKTEITRFKGLGEISEKEFKDFIGEKIRLEHVSIQENEDVHLLMTFYMGQNTPERQSFILENMKSEEEMEGTNI